MEPAKIEGDVDEISSQPRSQLPFKITQIMSSHGKEFLFGLAVILSAYAAFQNRPLKTRKVGFPEPFFSKNSLVTDYFWGNVIQAFERMQDSDITFVMYYAPWDASSMDVRWEFEKTAKYYHEQVYFAAINCWWPEGECRHHFPKIHSFPILIAYHHNGKGVQFQGIPNFPQFVRFLDHIINPITVIHSRLDLLKLLVKHNVVVLGFLDFHKTPQPSGYISFYIAAIKALERDPDRTIGFALLSNKVDASKFGLNASKTIHLYLWNSTQAFANNSSFSSRAILDWVFRKKAEVVRWLSPPGVKSLLLSSVLENSPTIIMLTPKYIASSLTTSPFYYMLKEVALDYFNCNGSSQVNNLIHTIKREVRSTSLEDDSSDSYCIDRKRGDAVPESGECCHSVAIENAAGSASYNGSVCSICRLGGVYRRRADINCRRAADDVSLVKANAPTRGCVATVVKLDQYSICCCYQDNSTHCYQDASPPQRDPRHLDNRFRCMLLEHSLVVNKIRSPRAATFSRKLANFTGLGCRINKTLAFVAMDALQFSLFFERLGVSVLSAPSKTAVAIIHAEQELHYILNEETTVQNLKEFVMNYTVGVLQRHSRSGRASEFVPADLTESKIVVREITSHSFNPTIMDETKDVVLLIYAPWCTFCYGISHIYLTAARYFQATEDIVFLRINGDANDLPWEFTVQKYPTIILFPANRKADSVGFPEDLPITVTNLVHFVLTHSKREIKLQTALTLCSSACIRHNRKLALSNIRRLLHHFRTTVGRLRGVQETLWQDCVDPHWSRGTNRKRVLNYMEYAGHLTDEMCDLRAQLSQARTLHLTLGTTEGDQLTRRQLETILESHGQFRNSFRGNECKDLANALNASLKICVRNFVGKASAEKTESK